MKVCTVYKIMKYRPSWICGENWLKPYLNSQENIYIVKGGGDMKTAPVPSSKFQLKEW